MNHPTRKTKPKRAADHGTFSNDPETLWSREGSPDRFMVMLNKFSFCDPKGKEWVTEAGYKVDGASIPRPLWSLIGSPYTGNYRRASIVHDRACDVAGSDATRRAADRMFYHACRAGECSIVEATLLYIGVRIGAWMSKVPVWKAAGSIERIGPRIAHSPEASRMQADYQLAADRVLQESETDDPIVIERRTDRALAIVSGVSLESKKRRR